MDARVRQFIERVGTAILECAIPPEDFKNITSANEIGKHAPKSAIERIEHLQAAAKEVQKPSDCDGGNGRTEETRKQLAHLRPCRCGGRP